MAAKAKPPALSRGSSPAAAGPFELDKSLFPDLRDLLARLHFSTTDGRIWLDDQRMLLIHARSLGLLRREMIETLGFDIARGLLTRMGYNA
ncbi:MAG TPA: XylR N-terminal domain-containing protein, partial [Elusimicrobiota bacterium]|nr:XylR N-terminal domain-containing protein [Elusimicrobiota bacterium]